MKPITIINILAIIASPIAAVLIGQWLQNKQKRTADKMEIFKTLMVGRGFGWSIDKVRALNLIEAVFPDCEDVLRQWQKYREKLRVENPDGKQFLEIKEEEDRLLDVMAKALGYKDKISWEAIQKPYIPQGLVDGVIQQNEFQKAQTEAIKAVIEGIKQGQK